MQCKIIKYNYKTMRTSTKGLLDHYRGLNSLDDEDLTFLLAHLFGKELDRMVPALPNPPQNNKAFWEWLTQKAKTKVMDERVTNIQDFILNILCLTGHLENWLVTQGEDLGNNLLDRLGSFPELYVEFWNETFPDNEIDILDVEQDMLYY